MKTSTKLVPSKPSRPAESAAVSTGCRLRRPVAEQKTQTDPRPCSSTESHEDLTTCNKVVTLNRHCAPGLHLIVCACVLVCVNGWNKELVQKKGFYSAGMKEGEVVSGGKEKKRQKERKSNSKRAKAKLQFHTRQQFSVIVTVKPFIHAV